MPASDDETMSAAPAPAAASAVLSLNNVEVIYDHVALAQLWGAMPALPREIPRFTKDLRQLWDQVPEHAA